MVRFSNCRRSVKVTAEPQKEFRLPVELAPPASKGYFVVKLNVATKGKQVAWCTTGFCVVIPVEERDQFFGVDANSAWTGREDALRMIGIKSLCVPLLVNRDDSVEKMKATIQNNVDTRWSKAFKSDFTLMGCLFFFNIRQFQPEEIEARRKADVFPYPDDSFAKFGNAVEAMAEVMKGRVKLWDCGEEVDGLIAQLIPKGGNEAVEIERYIRTIRVAHGKLKQTDPDNIMTAISIILGHHNDSPAIVKMFSDSKDYWEAISQHPYCGNDNISKGTYRGPEGGKLREAIFWTANLQAAYGKARTVYITEKGLAMPYHYLGAAPMVERP